ncbi:MAG: substrate-binding domain-containing protein [Treponema sp.]|jgi:simple sugar transport system substrate-binding protein|nr:substrate-binding domain-containing protein [Treponema sp.]
MKKIIFGALAALLVFTVAGCGGGSTTGSGNAELDALLVKYFPDQMKDGAVKIAVVRNLNAGDHTQQFLDGCVSEGVAMGFIVDTFVTNGDNAQCQETLAQVIQKDYDGIILSHGEAGYTYDALKPAVDKGMKVVTFDSVPYLNGDPNGTILTGVTSTAQEDYKLAELSLASIVENFPANRQPIKVVRAWMGPGVPPLDRRQTIYDRYVQEGKIVEVAPVGPVDSSNPRGGTQDSFAAVLPRFAPGSVDAIWGSYDELAKGCLQALDEAGRKDILLMSIDISNDDINLMLSHPDVWVSTAAVDPKLIGIADMRLLAAKFAGESTPDTYNLDAQSVKTTQLNSSIDMTNIATVVPGWGQEQGVYDGYAWMAELKAAVKK